MNWLLILGSIFLPGIVTAQNGTTDPLPSSLDNNTLLWEVSGNGIKEPSYLFGTFHLLCRDDIAFGPAINKAIKRSREVYLELDMDDPSTLLAGLMLINMKEGKKLKDLYSEEEYNRVSNYFKDSLSTSLAPFQRMKPNFLVALLYPKMMSCQNTSSVEEAVMQIAKDQDKEVKGLETIAFQASLFDSIPYENQAKELLNMVDSIEIFRSEFDLMMKSYLSQKLDQLEDQMADPKHGVAEFRNEILDKRNINWVSQLNSIMKERPVFVAIGAGHLVGNNGLISLLRKEGYVLRALENK